MYVFSLIVAGVNDRTAEDFHDLLCGDPLHVGNVLCVLPHFVLIQVGRLQPSDPATKFDPVPWQQPKRMYDFAKKTKQ